MTGVAEPDREEASPRSAGAPGVDGDPSTRWAPWIWVELRRVLRDPRNRRRTGLTALAVGTVLFMLNHLVAVIDGNDSSGVWIATGVSYVVPFFVANTGVAIAAHSATGEDHADAGTAKRHGAKPPAPTWDRVSQWPRCIAFPAHLRRTVSTALVVGTLYAGVNQLHALESGHLTFGVSLAIGLTYAVPFCVSNIGLLIGSRRSG